MKKMKIASLLLACALPFTANAADVCLKVNDQMYLKIKKPALTKGTISNVTGTLVVPATDERPVMYGSAHTTVVIHSDGRIDYRVNASTSFSFEDYDSVVNVYLIVRNTDKKTFTSGVDLDGSYTSFNWDEAETVQLSSVSCKTLPAF